VAIRSALVVGRRYGSNWRGASEAKQTEDRKLRFKLTCLELSQAGYSVCWGRRVKCTQEALAWCRRWLDEVILISVVPVHLLATGF
jgi:hypothetical protein